MGKASTLVLMDPFGNTYCTQLYLSLHLSGDPSVFNFSIYKSVTVDKAASGTRHTAFATTKNTNHTYDSYLPAIKAYFIGYTRYSLDQ